MAVKRIMEIRETAREANELLRAIGSTRRKRVLKEARLNARVQALKDRDGPEVEQLMQQEETLVKQLIELVVPKFVLLVVKGTKTIRLRSGEISLRLNPEALEITDDEATIIRRIKRRRGAGKYLRYKRTVALDKKALKEDPKFVAQIRGLDIVRQQSIVIRPARTQGAEIVRTTDNLSVPLTEED